MPRRDRRGAVRPTPPTSRPTVPAPTPPPGPRESELALLVRSTATSCELFATFDQVCPLCRLKVPARTRHKCGTSSSGAGGDGIGRALVEAFGGVIDK